MPWLRIDDGFPEHPKVLKLGKPEARWAWVELLAYCARRGTEGVVPDGIGDVLKRATPSFLTRCEQVGLLDVDKQGRRVVHDWTEYNGATLEERIAAFLADNPEATGNEVCRAVGGKRSAALAVLAHLRNGSGPVP